MDRKPRSADWERLIAAAVAMSNYPTTAHGLAAPLVGEMLPTVITPDCSVTLSRREYLSMQAAVVECDKLRADLAAAQAEVAVARGLVADLSRRPMAPSAEVARGFPAKALRFSV